MIFVHFDGDDVGSSLELLLLDEDVELARKYSDSITRALELVRDTLADFGGADIFVLGGDDLVVALPDSSFDMAKIEVIRRLFFEASGQTMSAGVGLSSSEATQNLRRAKLMGKNIMIASPAVLRFRSMKKLSALALAGSQDRLYIFVTSWRPDPYVNALVYSLQHFDIAQVYFASIVENDYGNEDDRDDEQADHDGKEEKKAAKSLNEIKTGIEERLQELAKGIYTRVYPDGSEEEVEIGPEGAALYKSCVSMMERLEVTSVTFPWIDLNRRLARYSEDGHGIFDVTALKNNLLVDVVIGLLSRGSTRIFAFEILKTGKPSYDERDLIHNMKEKGKRTPGEYVYRNLLENQNVKSAIARIVSRSLQVRSLIILTSVVATIIVLIQIFYARSWPETVVAVVAAVAAIGAWLSSLRSAK